MVNTLESLSQQVADLQKYVETGLSHRSERIVLMVDHSNFNQTWRRVETSSSSRPDYIKLQSFLADGRLLRQSRLYYSDVDACEVAEADKADWQRRQDFYTLLRHNNWTLRYVRKRVYEGATVEKGLDGALIIDMESICRDNRCDTIVLVAGDADYCEVVQRVQENYCVKVEVAFFPNQTARDLQTKAGKFINLDTVKDKFRRG
jgi:uncharacterized LabA/DUF88 family protein